MNKYLLTIKLPKLFNNSAIAILATLVSMIAIALKANAETEIVQSHSIYFSNGADDLYFDLAQTNINQFCIDYPYNSRCQDLLLPEKTESELITPENSDTPDQESRANKKEPSNWAVVGEASTLGLGASFIKGITPQFNGRVGINAFSLQFDFERSDSDSDIDYEGDLNLFNVSTILDFHPFKNSGFRLSGGLIFGSNSIEGIGVGIIAGEPVTLGNFESDLITSVEADVELIDDVTPYLGIGGGQSLSKGKGLGFWWNAGVALTGSPEISVDVDVVDTASDEERAEIEAAAEDEAEEIEEEFDFLGLYPVVSIGLSYQF